MSTEQSNSRALNVNKNGYLVTFTSSEESYRTYVCADFESFRSLIYKHTGDYPESYPYAERIKTTGEIVKGADLRRIRDGSVETYKDYLIPDCRINYNVHILSSVPSVESR